MSMIIKAANGQSFELTECPMCEDMGPHMRNESGMLTCGVCNTSFGTGALKNLPLSSWLPGKPWRASKAAE